jgi:hypothetical protein
MTETNRVTEIRNTMRAKAVGCCIYCGATSELSDEHVIPFALAGNIILPDSSCRTCAKITSGFERRVLRGFMFNARVAGNYPTRRPKDRPKSLSLQVESNGEFKQVELTPEEHPGLLFLPLLEPPSIFTGRTASIGVTVSGYETLYFGKDPVNVAKGLDVKVIQTSENWDVSSFARLLAKIAYSYVVTAYGLLPRDQIPVLPLILGSADDASFWLGSADFKLAVEARNPTHALAYAWIPDPNDAKKELLVVRIKLFVPSGATGYEIVVCRREKDVG